MEAGGVWLHHVVAAPDAPVAPVAVRHRPSSAITWSSLMALGFPRFPCPSSLSPLKFHNAAVRPLRRSSIPFGTSFHPELNGAVFDDPDQNMLVADPVLSGFWKAFVDWVEYSDDNPNGMLDSPEMTRRRMLKSPMLMCFMYLIGNIRLKECAYAIVPAAQIDLSKVPSRPFDATDERLRNAATIFENALKASTVVEEEGLWSEVIEKYESLEAEWVPDIVSRAYGNRGNARSRQGKLEQALEDYNKSILLAPYAVDPVLNRGVVLESLGRYDEASADYVAVLRVQPNDPAAWNNLGNVKAAQDRWDDALKGYAKAVELAPAFSFAAANYALALYQVGKVDEAVKQFRSLLRKYPTFPDMRAALAVSLYAQGLTAEAESNWERLEDGRYKDRAWVKDTRRWPPRLIADLERFLDVAP